MYEEKISIEILVDNDRKTESIKILKKHLSLSMMILETSIRDKKKIVLATLTRSSYYKGIDKIINLLFDFDEKNIGYSIYINEEIKGVEDVEAIFDRVKKMSRREIY